MFNTARSILVQFPSYFFSMNFFSVHVVHPYCGIDTLYLQSKWILFSIAVSAINKDTRTKFL